MADELNLVINARVAIGSLVEVIQPGSILADISAAELASGIQLVATTAEAIVTTDVTNLGWAYFQNMDTTNFILIGPDSGGTMIDMIKLLPGEPAIMRLKPGITVKAKADTASVKLLYKIFGT